MIISHKHKFIFIKTKKTAGTSIEVFLSQQCGDDDVVTPIQPHVEPHRARNHRGLWNPLREIADSNGERTLPAFRNLLHGKKYYNHITARVARSRIPRDTWDSYFKFSIERNPWDKTLSHYHMINDRTGGNLSFDDYLDQGKFCINYPFYTDADENLIVDQIVRYENLADGLGEVFADLGISYAGSLGQRAKADHRKDRRHYRDVYTDEQRARVDAAFAKEIEMHGYEY